MKYFVELLDGYSEVHMGKLYPVDPRTDRFGDESKAPCRTGKVEDETGYVVTI